MNFTVFRDRLVAIGYSDDTAYAKIAHDIVWKAKSIKASQCMA